MAEDPAGGRARASFPDRLGRLMAAPSAGLRAIDRGEGGGVPDALRLVLLGTLCFRTPALTHAAMSIGDTSWLGVLRGLLIPVGAELRDALYVALPAGILITLAAGRGRRDPGLDMDLGAACFAPMFVARAIVRALDAAPFVGSLPRAAGQVASSVGLLGAALFLALAIRVARDRIPRAAVGVAAGGDLPAGGGAGAPAQGDAATRRIARAAAALVAAILGAALAANVSYLASRREALRPIRAGVAAPDFTLPRLDAPGTLSLASLRGRVVLLDFWATWCLPCVAMIPMLHDLHARFAPEGVEFLGVNSDGPMSTPEEIRAFLRKHPPRHPMVQDDGTAGSLYRVSVLPHLVLVGRDGIVRKIFWGVTLRSELESALAEAVR